MTMIDVELQQYYEARLDMMSGKAWSDLIEDVQAMRDATNDLNSIQDEKTLHFRRGELSIMNWLLTLKDMSMEGYKQLNGRNDALDS